MNSIKIMSCLCIYIFISLSFLVACNRKAGKPDNFKAEVFNTKSDTVIIGTEFKVGYININRDISLNDTKYKNAYLVYDSIYFDFESIKSFFDLSKSNNTFSIHSDTNYIKKIFSLYKIPYRGQNKLVSYK